MATIGDLLGAGGLVEGYARSKLGKWLGIPLDFEDLTDALVCASIYLNSYKLKLSADKLEVWFYQPDNPDLGRHTEATFTAHLAFECLPDKDEDVRKQMLELAGCSPLPPNGPAPGKTIRWEIDGDLVQHGTMVPIESVTGSQGITTSDYQVATREETPKAERKQVETLSGMVRATAVGLLPTFDKLEVLFRGVRDDQSNPQRGRLPLLLSHYVRQPAYILRYGAEMSSEYSENVDRGPRGYERQTKLMEIRLASEVRLVRASNPDVFTGEGPIVYEPGCRMRFRLETGGPAGDDPSVWCDGIQTTRVTEFHPSTASATLTLTTRPDSTLDVVLEFSPGALHETEESQYVSVAGPCPSGPLYTGPSHYALESFRRAHAAWGTGRARITDWAPGTGGPVATASSSHGDSTTQGGSYTATWELHVPEAPSP